MTIELDTVVIGAGAVGLAIATRLAARGADVTVIERNRQAGAETSARSSEVIHAGIYYPPGSLKARLCAAGRDRLYAFCESQDVAVRRCGKLIVAVTGEELFHLDRIAKQAALNGVPGIEQLGRADLHRLEPDITGVAALLSPLTGVFDSQGFVAALGRRCQDLGATIALATNVTALARQHSGAFALRLTSSGDETVTSARRVIIAAGHGAKALCRGLMPDTYQLPRCTQAKGHYYALRAAHPFRHLIYPVPEAASLGVHLTIDVHGGAKFGPDIAWQADFDLSFDDASGERQARFERAIRRYWPGLPDGALTPSYTGIRPKIYGVNEAQADFLIDGPAAHGIDGLVILLGIESPGLTAALAIGEYVANLLDG